MQLKISYSLSEITSLQFAQKRFTWKNQLLLWIGSTVIFLFPILFHKEIYLGPTSIQDKTIGTIIILLFGIILFPPFHVIAFSRFKHIKHLREYPNGIECEIGESNIILTTIDGYRRIAWSSLTKGYVNKHGFVLGGERDLFLIPTRLLDQSQIIQFCKLVASNTPLRFKNLPSA